MSRRSDKPITLKTIEARRSAEVADLLSDLEGKSRARRPRARRALWTQEFLASGKIGKGS